ERFSILAGGNVGMGVSAPVENLELAGAIKIGNASSETADVGTIRYNNTNNYFEGRTNQGAGDVWIALNSAVNSVNTQTGNVVLTTSDITEGSNKYYTDTKVRAVTLGSFTSGAGTVASGDTYLQAIQKLNGNLAGLSTSTIPEGTNLYYTDTKVRAVTLGSFTSGAGTVASGDTYLQAIQKLNGNVVNVASTSQLGAGYAAAAGTVASTDTIKAAFQKLDGNIAAKISSQWSGSTGSEISYLASGVKLATLKLDPDVVLNTRNHTPSGGGPAYNVFQITLNNNSANEEIKLYKEEVLTTADGLDFSSIPGIDIFLANALDNMRLRISELETRLQNFGLL
ncbi:MAG: hypothetical protein IT236_10610, partial [Bacteroidia bacterium]|nr:hypothetical protein [Bacteroidia bacterium]